MTQVKATNVVWHEGHVDRDQRQALLKQQGVLIWLTGLPSSGKSTIAFTAEHILVEKQNRLAYVLDGDNVRHGLNKNLGFSAEDRAENIRRIGDVAKLFSDAGVVTITSFISPYRADRDLVRALHEDADMPFLEVFVDAPLEVAEMRDPKGLYKKARAGEIKGFTGIDDPYEAPANPELHLRTDQLSVEQSVQQLLDLLEQRGLLTA